MFQGFKVQLVGVEGGRQKTDSESPKSMSLQIWNVPLSFAAGALFQWCPTGLGVTVLTMYAHSAN